MTVGTFAELVSVVGTLYGFSVTSWGRSLIHNKQEEGAEFSAHPCWLGVDGNLDDARNKPAFIRRCGQVGLKVLDEGDHLHVQPADWR